MRFAFALVSLCLGAGAALAQDGGKIPWANKKNDEADTHAVIAKAKSSGMPMMLFFTSEG